MTKALSTIAIAIAVSASACFVRGWRSAPAPLTAGSPPADEIMYVCRETRALSRGPRQTTPALDPKTGRRTLVQALYCPKCRKWYPAPPVELFERMPGGPVCPRTGTPLVETEPGA